jgi:aspartate-semialdehyde dehydrogenase
VFIEFTCKPSPTPEQDIEALSSYVTEPQKLNLPSAPPSAIVVLDDVDRPQPRLDINIGNGNSVVVGRVRPCSILDIKLTLLSHNTILGAAGSSILNAETAINKGLIN